MKYHRLLKNNCHTLPPPPNSLCSFTCSLKGSGGTDGSRWNNSSHRRAFMHKVKLSTSLAIGPVTEMTVKKRERKTSKMVTKEAVWFCCCDRDGERTHLRQLRTDIKSSGLLITCQYPNAPLLMWKSCYKVTFHSWFSNNSHSDPAIHMPIHVP